jgi:hypothetical protein
MRTKYKESVGGNVVRIGQARRGTLAGCTPELQSLYLQNQSGSIRLQREIPPRLTATGLVQPSQISIQTLFLLPMPLPKC